MTDQAPLSPVEAGRALWQIGEDIKTKTDDLIALRKDKPYLARAKRAAYARSFLGAREGTQEFKKQMAIMDSDEAQFQLEVHEQEMEACKDKLHELRDRSEIGRSINSNLKEELRTFNQTGQV
jgi:hypothetical protein